MDDHRGHDSHLAPERRLFLRSELLDATFDEPLPDALFTLTPPPGEEAMTPSELHAHGLSVEEAAERASFPIFALGELPDGPWRLAASHSRARREIPERISLLYHRSDGRGQIVVTEVRAGAEHHLWHGGGARVELEREGTTLILTSEDYDEDELRRLAGTLTRA